MEVSLPGIEPGRAQLRRLSGQTIPRDVRRITRQ